MRRTILILLSLVWGFLVYGTHHSIGYDRAEGYPSVASSLWWAIPSALPMLLGAFMLDKDAVLKYERWFCIACLIAQGIFLLFFSWLKILAFPPLLGVWLIISAGTKTELPQTANKELLQKVAFGAIVFGIWVWLEWFHFLLPSDADMIRDFNAHRAELEQLVQDYRDFRRFLGTPEVEEQYKKIHAQEDKLRRLKKLTPEARKAIDEARKQAWKDQPPSYEALPKTIALKEKARVYRLDNGKGGRWFPDHYSTKTIEAVKQYTGWRRSIHNPLYEEESMAILRRELPSLFVGQVPVRESGDANQLTEAILLHRGTLKQPDDKSNWRYGTFLYKGYMHFPQPPRIENGHLLAHDFRTSSGLGKGLRVQDSLDSYPPNWQPGECVLKRINDHWFIALCQTY